ncbi:hypothetical protein VFA_002548 [Vibrio furnissii CIP 102972]|nr:hypothetical protein VFA_002548 [Vibrio furnissii CIP 102972]
MLGGRLAHPFSVDHSPSLTAAICLLGQDGQHTESPFASICMSGDRIT